LDKLLGLGKSTPAARAWLEGGSPTSGFLKGVTGPDSVNPLKDVYSVFVGHSWADWLFMIGLLGIGLALILGIGMRVAAVSGTVLMLMMYGASLPIATNPFLDDHIIYAMVMIVLALTYAGDTLGLGKVWGRTALVQKLPVLR
jgi:thiosulfate dehydrogenase [quinone] large subunit